MYPNLFGIEGFSMVVLILLGVIAASIIFLIFLKRKGLGKKEIIDLLIVITVTVLVGVIFAILFENLYEAVKAAINGATPHWTWGMTFIGGLFAGIIAFILTYRFYYLKDNKPIFKDILIIAPGCVCIGHAFGRVGCFLSGCCYGIETHTALDVYFPIHHHSYLPTQLIEMTFLLILGGFLLVLAFKNITNYNSIIYLLGYGIFRFVIEFFRGDERGQLVGLSPSQYWCLVMIIGAIPLYIYLKKKIYNEIEFKNEI